MEIGCNYFQGADLSRRLLHGSTDRLRFLGFQTTVQRLDHLQVPHTPSLRVGIFRCIGNTPNFVSARLKPVSF